MYTHELDIRENGHNLSLFPMKVVLMFAKLFQAVWFFFFFLDCTDGLFQGKIVSKM